MMVSSNNGVGMNTGFPDVCLSPPPPPAGPVPVPYPNIGMNTMSSVFSPNIFTGFMPALNMASLKPQTNGDNSGCLNPLFMQAGGQTAGNPIVFVNCVPAKHLCVPSYGNAFNCSVDATAVPSISTTLYTDRQGWRHRAEPVGPELVRTLDEARHGEMVSSREERGALVVRLARFTSDVATGFFNAVRGFDGSAVVIDLRANPGGDTHACLDLLDDFVAEGVVLAQLVEAGEAEPWRARASRAYAFPLVVVVDGDTASAAELFAGSLQALGRAAVVGSRTAGKGSAQRLVVDEADRLSYASVAEVRLPDGRPIQGVGICPDLQPAGDPLAAALAIAAA